MLSWFLLVNQEIIKQVPCLIFYDDDQCKKNFKPVEREDLRKQLEWYLLKGGAGNSWFPTLLLSICYIGKGGYNRTRNILEWDS